MSLNRNDDQPDLGAIPRHVIDSHIRNEHLRKLNPYHAMNVFSGNNPEPQILKPSQLDDTYYRMSAAQIQSPTYSYTDSQSKRRRIMDSYGISPYVPIDHREYVYYDDFIQPEKKRRPGGLPYIPYDDGRFEESPYSIGDSLYEKGDVNFDFIPREKYRIPGRGPMPYSG
jgi:hypothetical protein